MSREFPGIRFRSAALTLAGAHLKKGDEPRAITVLREEVARYGAMPGNVRPPAKCNVVAFSRPFVEWPIYKASRNIQAFVFNLSEAEAEALPPPGTKVETRNNWFARTGVDPAGFTYVAGFNKIFAATYGIREGVFTKADNRNKKLEARGRETVSPIDAEGRLIHPPGANPSIYCWQDTFSFVDPVKDAGILTAARLSYALDPDDTIPNGVTNRLSIPLGSPGYVPAHQRIGVNRHKRRVRAYGGPAILGKIEIGDDWALVDLRGLLRNIRWRLDPLKITVRQLLDYFTGDPVVDPRTGVVTCVYKEGLLDARKRKVCPCKFSVKELRDSLARGPVTMLSIDLGVNNPVAAKASSIICTEGALGAQVLGRTLLPDWQLKEKANYYEQSDKLQDALRARAIEMLTAEQRAEFYAVRSTSATAVKTIVESWGVVGLPWDQMTSRSHLIADALESLDEESRARAYWVREEGEKIKKYDSRFARDLRPKISEETNRAYREALFEAQRESDGFAKLSKWKSQMGRQIVNDLYAWAHSFDLSAQVVFNVEDLNISFFHGKGRLCEEGWDAFFLPKIENRWFMQVLHKSICDLAAHRGVLVIESAPYRTSQTCPDCGYVDADNRRGEGFQCLGCGVCYHADLEVATDNLERVALTGKPLPRARERSGDDVHAVIARESKSVFTQGTGRKTMGGCSGDVSKAVPLANGSVAA